MQYSHRPLVTALRCALFVGAVQSAHAQTVPSAEPSPAPASVASEQDSSVQDMDAVTVTGILLQRERAAAQKYAAEGIVDVVSADEIGKLPVKNAAEAVGRLPGVSFSVDQGEGRYISVRGVSPQLNNVTINGVDTGSQEADNGGRLVPLDVVGASSLKSIEVIKANTPDRDAQGIGGTVNLETKGPFDFDQEFNAIGSVREGYDTANEKHPYSADLTLAGTNSARTWGWVVSGSHEYRRLGTVGVYQDDWRVVEQDGVSSRLPTNAKYNHYDIGRTRNGFSGQLEWRPAAGHRVYLRGLYSEFTEVENRQRSSYYFTEEITSLGATTGTSTDNNRRQELRQEEKSKMLSNVALGGEHQVDGWAIDWVAQHNRNRQREPNRSWQYRENGYGDTSWMMKDNGLANLEGTPVNAEDLRFHDYSSQLNRTEEDGNIFGLDLQREFDDYGSYVKFGGKYRRTERDRDFSNLQYDAGSEDWYLSEGGQAGPVFNDHVGGVNNPNRGIHLGASTRFLEEHINDPQYFDLNEGDTFESEYDGDYHVEEKVSAGYLMANLMRGPLSVILGGRYEHTQVDSGGYTLEDSTATPVQANGSYHNWLPAVVGRWDINQGLVLRAAWTRTLGRPDYDQIAPISTFSRDGSLGYLTIGNAGLKPRRSTNYDLSLEWYFGPGDLLSAALFYKDIKDQIVSRSHDYTDYTYDGEQFDQFTRTTYENADNARVRGVELNYQHQFAFLPPPFDGLGVGLSYARITSETKVAGRDDSLGLVQQPDWTGTATLFYQKGPWQLGITDMMSGGYLAEVADVRAEDILQAAYHRVDLQASYQISPRVSVFLQGQNVNNEPTIQYQGHIPYQNTQYESYGRTYYLGLSAKF